MTGPLLICAIAGALLATMAAAAEGPAPALRVDFGKPAGVFHLEGDVLRCKAPPGSVTTFLGK